jgi:hypothetical protein
VSRRKLAALALAAPIVILFAVPAAFIARLEGERIRRHLSDRHRSA